MVRPVPYLRGAGTQHRGTPRQIIDVEIDAWKATHGRPLSNAAFIPRSDLLDTGRKAAPTKTVHNSSTRKAGCRTDDTSRG
jgi:hypothetical protein